MDPLLFSVADAAPLLGIRETALRDLIDAGKIPIVQHRPGGDAFIRRSDLEAYVAGLPAKRKGEPVTLSPTVTNPITNPAQAGRTPARRGGPGTVKPVRVDLPDEEGAGAWP